MRFTLFETKLQNFLHYIIRWFLVPRKTQRVLRYFAIFIFLLYTSLALFFPSYFSGIPSGSMIYAFLTLFLLLPFIGAAISAMRLKTANYEIVVDENRQWIKLESKGISSQIDVGRFKKTYFGEKYLFITVKTESFDHYIYVFRDQMDLKQFELLRDMLKEFSEV